MTSATSSLSFKVDAESGPLAVRELLDSVLSALTPISLDMEELGTIEIVLAEALNNVVEHAYPDAARPGPIEVSGQAMADGLHFRIEDSGCPMPDGHAPLGNAVDTDVDKMDLPEGGFGWFIIRDLAKDVLYERHDEKNILSLRLAITRTAV